jgi:hypothetical protein
MKSLSEHTLDNAIKYHIENHLPVYENIFRAGTPMHFKLLETFKDLYESEIYIPLDEDEEALLQTDIGTWGVYEGENVPLDYPMFSLEEEKQPELNSPKRGGRKKFYVYVKDPDTGNIKKIEWGDTTGLKMKIDNPAARKSFVARHRCDQANDKMTASYWMCRVPRYGKQLGLSPASTGNFFW